MEERSGNGRDCVMGKEIRVHGYQGIGLLAALAAVLLVPITAAAPASAQETTAGPMTSIAMASGADQQTEQEQVTIEALRTSGTLAAVALSTTALVWLWWYLARRRRD
jgi:hypothetical protein